jgi:hypothetical protein
MMAPLSIYSALLLLLFSLSGARGDDLKNAAYKDPTKSVEDRVADLLPRMSITDKVAQLMQGQSTCRVWVLALTRKTGDIRNW